MKCQVNLFHLFISLFYKDSLDQTIFSLQKSFDNLKLNIADSH
jgi:hypothetical protein